MLNEGIEPFVVAIGPLASRMGESIDVALPVSRNVARQPGGVLGHSFPMVSEATASRSHQLPRLHGHIVRRRSHGKHLSGGVDSLFTLFRHTGPRHPYPGAYTVRQAPCHAGLAIRSSSAATCWEQPDGLRNCGHCENCRQTMMVLASLGLLPPVRRSSLESARIDTFCRRDGPRLMSDSSASRSLRYAASHGGCGVAWAGRVAMARSLVRQIGLTGADDSIGVAEEAGTNAGEMADWKRHTVIVPAVIVQAPPHRVGCPRRFLAHVLSLTLCVAKSTSCSVACAVYLRSARLSRVGVGSNLTKSPKLVAADIATSSNCLTYLSFFLSINNAGPFGCRPGCAGGYSLNYMRHRRIVAASRRFSLRYR